MALHEISCFKPVKAVRAPTCTCILYNWARLFKTNDVVSLRFVKISNFNISNMPIFFVEKMLKAFAVQKLLSFFSTKNFSVFGYKVVKHLKS